MESLLTYTPNRFGGFSINNFILNKSNMETKELKVQAPEGYEVDREKSTFDCIKFKPIKKNITYKDVSNELFSNKCYYYIDSCGDIQWNQTNNTEDINNAINRKQLEKILAMNQLLNIAEYYNKKHPEQGKYPYCIVVKEGCKYEEDIYDLSYYKLFGLVVLFNRKEDVQAVIDNPNFRKILDTVYKD